MTRSAFADHTRTTHDGSLSSAVLDAMHSALSQRCNATSQRDERRKLVTVRANERMMSCMCV
jgi:hypothetical protein